MTSACSPPEPSRGTFEAVDGRDVGMVERRQRLRLALESHHAIGIGRECGGQHLQGDGAVELGIARAIHLGAEVLAFDQFHDKRGRSRLP